jgi:outer membrane receptor protein involved in Fe transport
MSATFEVQNLTDEQRYDFVGAQRPGRTFYAKVGGEI